MAYAPRPDGLYDVTLDGGLTLPMALSEQQLQAAGHQPLPALPPAGPGPTAFGMAQQAPNVGLGAPAPAAPDVPKPVPGFEAPAPARPMNAGEQAVQQALRDQGVELPTTRGSVATAPSGDRAVEVAPGSPEPAPVRADPRNLRRVGAPAAPSAAVAGGAPARVHRVKGGDVRASFTRVPGMPVPDDVRRDLTGNTDAEDLEISADNIAGQRDELTQQREAAAIEGQRAIDRQVVQRQAIDREIARKRSAIEQRDREAEQLTPQSAREVWADMGIFGQIAAALAIALGGYQQGLTGSARNAGLDMVMQGIRDEVEAQRYKYERALEKKQEARGDYAEAIQMYGTPEAAALDIEMRRLAAAERIVQARAERVGTQEYLQQANQLASELRAKRAEKRLQLQELEAGKTQENWVNVPDRVVTTGGAPKPKKPENMVRLPGGQYMFARDSVSARAAQSKIIANARMAQLAGRMRALTDTVGKRAPTEAERAQAETIKSEMMFTYKDASQAGALDKGLQDAMATYLGNAENVFTIKDGQAKLGEVQRIATRKIGEVMEYELHPDETYTSGVAPRPAEESDE
jgi:hypothetical protein